MFIFFTFVPVFILMLPLIFIGYNILAHLFAFIAAPIMSFIENIFGEDIFEKAGKFLDISIWVLGIILTLVIGYIAVVTF